MFNYNLNVNLETEEERTQYLINMRKNNIKELEKILQGKHVGYKKYMNDQTFLNSVKKQLEIEKDLLNQLVEDKALSSLQRRRKL